MESRKGGMRILIAALLSVAIFQTAPTGNLPANLNNSITAKPAKAETVQVATPEKVAVVESTAPTEPTTVIEPEVSHPIGCENYRHLISQYDWNVEVMLQISHKESGCNPSAVGDNYVIRGTYAPSCGLFQVRTLSSRPSCEALKDPATNIAWAYRIYQGQGFGAWSVCSSKVRCS